MLRYAILGAGSLALLTPPVSAGVPESLSLLFAMDGNEITLDNASGLVEAGLIREDEVGIVTPVPGFYSASIFLSTSAQWAFIGDLDNDGRLVDSSVSGPGDDTDAILVKRFGVSPGEVGPRDVFVSKEGNAGFDTSVFEDGDVYSYAAQGVVEVFITEVQVLDLIGQATTADLDVDAICQSSAGDLFLSFDLGESVGGETAEDGSIVYVPASALTYDGNGNVSAVVSDSAVIIATEADVNTLIAASGVLTSVGGTPSTSIDVTALEIDPNGGTWDPPQGGLTGLPNLFFAWSGFSNDGAVLSTAGGGMLAALNGVPLASDVATTGTQLGLLPDSTGLGGLMGMGVIPERADPLVNENYPSNLITTSTTLFTRNEVSGAVPGGFVAFFVDFGPGDVGSVLPAGGLPQFSGQFFGLGSPVLLAVLPVDAGGHASLQLQLEQSLSGSGINVAWQVYDVLAGALGTPAAMQFL